MTVLPDAVGASPALFGHDGELVTVRVFVEPRLLEDLLEALASVEFPINPQLYHQTAQVAVEFPAYSNQLEKIRAVLIRNGFDAATFTHQRVLARVQTA
jgi:hypothetical protein